MNQLYYGVWDSVVYDNRSRNGVTLPEGLPLEQFAQFNSGNPTLSFIGDKGFFILSPHANLAYVLWKHHQRIAQESCGKCTPCRAGSRILLDALDKARLGRGHDVDWRQVRAVAEQMCDTAACGIGQTGPRALLAALDHFADLLINAPDSSALAHDAYSTVTSRCIEACPAHVNVPRYIDYIRDGHPELAMGAVLKHYPLVGSCGRVCVRLCESACRRKTFDTAVDIKNLKRFAADNSTDSMESLFADLHVPAEANSLRVAVVGAGPAGITCAYHLLLRGYHVDIFEKSQYAGGMARCGIPTYRLPKGLLQSETEVITRLGGRYLYNQALGRDFTISSLFSQGYNAVFIGMGCSQGMFLRLPDEDTTLEGYQNGIDFLLQVHDGVNSGSMPKLSGDVVIVGGGNVAMDCARSAVRLTDGTVHIVYRRTEEDAPADHEEILAAKEEGIQFHFLALQEAILSENGKVTGLRCSRMEQGEPDASGRRSVNPVPDSSWELPCSHIIAAIGQRIDHGVLTDEDGIQYDRRGNIAVNEALATSRPGVFAGGDCATGPTTLIGGMAQGRTAAQSIHDYLTRGSIGFVPRTRMSQLIKLGRFLDDGAPEVAQMDRPRTPLRALSPQERDHNFKEVDLTMSSEDAAREASRCMRCYRVFSVVTQLPIPGND
ncbi:MAG: FAD-dependent oxidoreductase [Desulfovibrionaceae bacterium]|nr:FAD-dependent oxidoreductase [Desulfovibrionaceae bacterium]